MKICIVCGCENFSRSPNYCCRKCRDKDYNAKYYIKNKDEIDKKNTEWYKENKEKQSEFYKEYYKNNREDIIEKVKKYKADRKEILKGV